MLMSLVEHGFGQGRGGQRVPDAGEPDGADRQAAAQHVGRQSGGMLHARAELQVEAVRQLRGQSTAQVPNVEVSMVISGPMVTPVSSMILGSEAVL